MKLCKDCKHARFPHPMDALLGVSYCQPMCAHPDAPREPVLGHLTLTCSAARGAFVSYDASKGARMPLVICGDDAKLFEQREADPREHESTNPMVVLQQAGSETRKGWIERLLGG